MARGPVWIEAYEQYLLRKNVCEKSELERLSDDALVEKYFQYVREADCEEAMVNLVCESVICMSAPDDTAIEACKALGKAVAG